MKPKFFNKILTNLQVKLATYSISIIYYLDDGTIAVKQFMCIREINLCEFE